MSLGKTGKGKTEFFIFLRMNAGTATSDYSHFPCPMNSFHSYLKRIFKLKVCNLYVGIMHT